MKTYHNDANTSGIIKIALKIFLGFSLTKKIDSQNCKNLIFKVIFLRQKLSKSLQKKIIEEYQFRTTTFAKIIF